MLHQAEAALDIDCDAEISALARAAAGGVNPVAHALTDTFALNGTIMALDVLGLPVLTVEGGRVTALVGVG